MTLSGDSCGSGHSALPKCTYVIAEYQNRWRAVASNCTRENPDMSLGFSPGFQANMIKSICQAKSGAAFTLRSRFAPYDIQLALESHG